MLPRKCSRLGLAFWNLNKYPAFSSSWVEKCYSDSTQDQKKKGDLTQKRRETCIQWHTYGQQKLMPVTFAGCTVKQWLQTGGDTRDLEGYSVCTYMYTLCSNGSQSACGLQHIPGTTGMDKSKVSENC